MVQGSPIEYQSAREIREETAAKQTTIEFDIQAEIARFYFSWNSRSLWSEKNAISSNVLQYKGLIK